VCGRLPGGSVDQKVGVNNEQGQSFFRARP
jgi:hypothetical protein